MRMRSLRRALLRGTLLAAGSAAMCWAIAALCFGRAFYLAVLLPLCMMIFLLLAWLAYLKDDGFARRGRPSGDAPRGSGAGNASRVADPGEPRSPLPPELSLFAPRGDVIIERAPTGGGNAVDGGRAGMGSLLVAALELGALAAALYAFAGVGERFFL